MPPRKRIVPSGSPVPNLCSDVGHVGRVGQPGHQDVLGRRWPVAGALPPPCPMVCVACERARGIVRRQLEADRAVADGVEDDQVRTRLGNLSRPELAALARAILRRVENA